LSALQKAHGAKGQVAARHSAKPGKKFQLFPDIATITMTGAVKNSGQHATVLA
jgi:hypothetical protein